MNVEEKFKFFVYYILPVLIFFFGLIGNIFGIIISFKQNFKKIGPLIIYRFLFLTDSVYLLFIVTKYLQFGFNISFDDVSSTWCKVNRYFYYSLDAISPMLIVYIALDRFIAIRFSSRRKTLRIKSVQVGFFAIVFFFNAFYYSPIPIFQDLVDHPFNQTNTSVKFFCDFVDAKSQFILSWMDFVNLVAVPFLCMITLTILLIYVIFGSRKRVISNYSNSENRTFQRDVKFAVTSIGLNLIYIILQLPLALVNFNTSFNDYTFLLCVYVFFASYGANFYIVLLTNYLVREEFLLLFRFKRLVKLNQPSTNGTNNTFVRRNNFSSR